MGRDGCAAAVDALFARYKSFVRMRASAFFLQGGDHDDLIQEGMIGFYKAVRDYVPEREDGASFETFASLCVTRQLLHAVEKSSRKKNSVLNEAVELTDEELEGGITGTASASPETIILQEEASSELLRTIRGSLSRMECEVLDLHLLGYDYVEIASILGRPAKSIDNALQRIRRKAKAPALGRKEDGQR